MGIIKTIKSNELIGGDNYDNIYPITSTQAVFDKDNISIEDKFKNIELENSSLNNAIIEFNEQFNTFKDHASEVEVQVGEALGNNVKAVYNIRQEVSSLNNKIEDMPKEMSYIKGSISSTPTRASQTLGSHNIDAFCPVDEGFCFVGENINIEGFKDGNIFIPKNPGVYTIEGSTLNIEEVSIIQKLKDKYVALSLGIPFIPKPTLPNDAGKSLLVAEDGSLYWG